MSKVMIIGANGYLGRHLSAHFSKNGINFIPCGKSKRSIDGYQNYVQVDITNKDSIEALDFNVDHVFVLAGLTGTPSDEGSKQRFTVVNENGLKNILEACRSTKPHVIFPSSRLVYKGQENVFLDENAIKEAKTIYAQNKLNCEKMLQAYHQHNDINYTIFRICVPYGNNFDANYSYGTIGFFLSKALKGENITLFGKGEVKRTFTHIQDINEVLTRTLKNGDFTNETVNIGGQDNLSLFELAQKIASKFNVNVEFSEWPEYALSIESGDTLFSDKKLKTLCNYKYKNCIDAWLKSI